MAVAAFVGLMYAADSAGMIENGPGDEGVFAVTLTAAAGVYALIYNLIGRLNMARERRR
jgi:hypothetical protein